MTTRGYLRIVGLALFCLLALAAPTKAFALPAINIPSDIPIKITAGIVEDCTKNKFFGLVPWYQYIGPELDNSNEHKCEVKCFNVTELETNANACGQTKSDIPLVLLAVIDDLLRITGIVAVAYVLYGGFRYVGSQGNPEQTAKAQNTIMNALIGLAIAVISVSFIAFLGHKLGG